MDTEKVKQFECKVCGRRIDVTRTGDVYEEPIYCCGVQSVEVSVPAGMPAAAPAKKKPAKKAAKKKRAVRLTSLAKYFERIGDHPTNVCEQVVFMVEGRVIKHPGLTGEPKDEAQP